MGSVMGGPVGLLFAALQLAMVIGVVVLAVLVAMALVAWRRRLLVATELDRLRIERLVADGTLDE